MRCRLLTKVTITLIVLAVLIPLVTAESIPTDKTGAISAVIDGSSFQLSSGETIKLAAIDTPNSGHPGYSESKNYLTILIQGKPVYLDIGVAATTDQKGRLLCVVYLDYNSTHYENVNMAMIQNGYAIPSSLNYSYFNPSSWFWFVPKNTPSPSSTSSSTPTTSPSVSPYSPPPTPTIDPSFLTSTQTAIPSVSPYSPPSTPLLSLSVPEFLVLASLIIISIVIASVIFLKLHKKKN
jgi:hypothetical protein